MIHFNEAEKNDYGDQSKNAQLQDAQWEVVWPGEHASANLVYPARP